MTSNDIITWFCQWYLYFIHTSAANYYCNKIKLSYTKPSIVIFHSSITAFHVYLQPNSIQRMLIKTLLTFFKLIVEILP